MTGVAVIDDHPLYRQGLAVAIEAAPGMDFVLAARSVEDFDAHTDVRPDVVILDLHLRGLEGPQAVAHLCERGLAVLVVSVSDDQDAVLDAMAAGASGYLTKDAEASEITTAVAAIAGGRDLRLAHPSRLPAAGRPCPAEGGPVVAHRAGTRDPAAARLRGDRPGHRCPSVHQRAYCPLALGADPG